MGQLGRWAIPLWQSSTSRWTKPFQQHEHAARIVTMPGFGPLLGATFLAATGGTMEASQARDELAFERTTTLNEQRLIDRLMADAHRPIIREIDPEPMKDLFRTPRHRPPPVLPVRLIQPLPNRSHRAGERPAVRPSDAPSEPILNVLTQPLVACELRGRRPLGRLLCHQNPVLLRAAPRRRVTTQLA